VTDMSSCHRDEFIRMKARFSPSRTRQVKLSRPGVAGPLTKGFTAESRKHGVSNAEMRFRLRK
jgi:hypothetical protein